MKQLFSILVLSLFVSNAFADDWRMRKLDADLDGFVVKQELKAAGCKVKPGLFNAADKNDDGKLSKKELRIASEYIVRRACPNGLKTPKAPKGIRG